MKKCKRFVSLFLVCFTVSLCFSNVAIASEKNPLDTNAEFSVIPASASDTSSRGQETLKDFSGTYYGWIDVPFTVTDSSRVVKVMYSVRALDNSPMVSHLGVRIADKTLWFWTKLDLSGNSQIQEIGTLKPGDYILQIKTNQTSKGYVIAGKVYYFM